MKVLLPTIIVGANLENPIQRPYVGRRTWSLQLHTPHLKIIMMGILLLLGRMVLALFLFGWEEHKVMLWKMKRVHFSKWQGFNDGLLWRRVQIWINNICMKIVGMESENVILQIQNNGLTFYLFFFFHF